LFLHPSLPPPAPTLFPYTTLFRSVETVVALSLGTKYLLDPAALARIRDILGAGGLVVHPTDTVYGLAADPFQAGAVDKLYAAKSDRKSTRLNSSHQIISYAVFCLK